LDDYIHRYISEHRERFTDVALRDQLLAAGHPADAVDRAIARVRSPIGRAPLGRVIASRLAVLVVAHVFIVAMLAGGMGALYALGGSFGSSLPTGLVLVAYVVALGLGLGWAARRIQAAEAPAATWLDLGVAFGAAALILVGLSGACIAGLSVM
jgi:hypothetical protein